MKTDIFSSLVKGLTNLPNETETIEFKNRNFDPDLIGKDISALANSASYRSKDKAYMIWGVDDESHEIVGTSHTRFSKLVGNEEIGLWLRRMLSRNADFDFEEGIVEGKSVVVLTINKAVSQPVTFKKDPYIRVGSNTKPLREYPSMESQLWNTLRLKDYESLPAKSGLSADNVLEYLDFSQYFSLQGLKYPEGKEAILHFVVEDELVERQADGLFSITNLGALLFARRLKDFPHLRNKAFRIIQYEDNTKAELVREFEESGGYVVDFQKALDFLDAILPSKEVIGSAFRTTVKAYPPRAIREILANSLIHQDFSISGASPLVEVFSERVEVTNPGPPLVDINRIIDNPPKSRNGKLSSMMRRLKLCEASGSGWDRIVLDCEKNSIPAPRITVYDEYTRVTLYSHVPFAHMTRDDKIWSCYLHACLKSLTNGGMTNSSLRERFGLDDSYTSQVSRLIQEAVNSGMIKKFDPSASLRYSRYVPFWA